MTNQKLQGWLLTATPDEIIAEIQRRIRQCLGNDVEDRTVIKASHGYFRIRFNTAMPDDLEAWNDVPFRRGAVNQLAKDLSAAKRKAKKAPF